MTETTARIQGTDIALSHDPQTDPDLVGIALLDEDGDERARWHQRTDRLVGALSGAQAPGDFTFEDPEAILRLVVRPEGCFAEVEELGGDGDTTEQTVQDHLLARALRECGAVADRLPEEVLVPELARVARPLGEAGLRVIATVPPQANGLPLTSWFVLERDGLAAYVQASDQPLATHFDVSMPIRPNRQTGSAVGLENDQVPYGDDETSALLAAVEQALVPQAYSPVTGQTHRNDGIAHYGWNEKHMAGVAGPALPAGGVAELIETCRRGPAQPWAEKITVVLDETTRKPEAQSASTDGRTGIPAGPAGPDALVVADGSGHEFRVRLLNVVEPMDDRQNDGHLHLSFQDDGQWFGACAVQPDDVRKLMAMCATALDRLAPPTP